MMKINTRFCLFCREDCERQQSASTALDMCILQGKTARFEIVRIKGFNFYKEESYIYNTLQILFYSHNATIEHINLLTILMYIHLQI